MPLGDNPIEELAALAKLHNEINRFIILKGLLEGDNVGMLGQISHNRHLSPHILDVDLRPQLALGNGLAGEGIAGLNVKALVRNPELPAAELLPEAVFLENVVAGGLIGENRSREADGGLANRFDERMIRKRPDVSAPLGEGRCSGLHGNAASHGRLVLVGFGD